MIEYVLNGKTVKVSPEEQSFFELNNPMARKKRSASQSNTTNISLPELSFDEVEDLGGLGNLAVDALQYMSPAGMAIDIISKPTTGGGMQQAAKDMASSIDLMRGDNLRGKVYDIQKNIVDLTTNEAAKRVELAKQLKRDINKGKTSFGIDDVDLNKYDPETNRFWQEYYHDNKRYKIWLEDHAHFMAHHDDAVRITKNSDANDQTNFRPANMPTVDELMNATGTGFSQESNLADYLNEFFKDDVDENGIPKVRVEEITAGWDGIEVLVGDQERGEGNTYEWGGFLGGETFFNKDGSLWGKEGDTAEIRKREIMGDILFDISKATDKQFEDEFYDWVDKYISTDDTVADNYSYNKAIFANNIDKKRIENGELPEDYVFQTQIHQGKAGYRDNPVAAGMNDFGNPTAWAGWYDKFDKNPDIQGRMVQRDWANTVGLEEVWGAVGFGSSDPMKADMTGTMTFTDKRGKTHEISYGKLWKLREEIYFRKKFPNKQKEKEQFVLDKFGDKQSVIQHAGYDKVYQALPHKDKKIVNIRDEINLIKSGKVIIDGNTVDINDKNKEASVSRLAELKADLQELMKKYPEQWYDPETGEGVHPYTQGEWIDMGDGTMINDATGVEMPLIGNDDEIAELAERNSKEQLEDQVYEKYINVLTMVDLVHNNWDKIEDGSTAAGKWLGENYYPVGHTHWYGHDADTRQINKAFETGDVFDLDMHWRHSMFYDYEKEAKKAKKGEDTHWLYHPDDDYIYRKRSTPFLGKLSGDSKLAQQYNTAIDEYVTFARALALNVDLYSSKDEDWAGRSLKLLQKGFTDRHFYDNTLDEEQYAIFSNFLEEQGYETPEHISDGFFDTSGTRADGTMRSIGDGVSEFGAGMAPLVASIWATKRILPVTKLKAGVQARGINAANKAKAWSRLQRVKGGKMGKWFGNKYTASAIGGTGWVMNNVMIPGWLTVAEWGFAEKFVGENIFGWDAQTLKYDRENEKWEMHAAFPFWMGTAGHLFGMFAKWAVPKVTAMENPIGRMFSYMRGASKGELVKPFDPMKGKFGGGQSGGLRGLGELSATAVAKAAPGFGQGVTGTALLTIAEGMNMLGRDLFFDPVAPGSREASRREEEWKELTSIDHLASQFILMSGLGFAGMGKSAILRKEMSRDVLNLSKKPSAKEQYYIDQLELNNVKGSKTGYGTYEPTSIWSQVNSKNSKLSKEIKELQKEGPVTEQTNQKIKELQNRIESNKLAGRTVERMNNRIVARIKAEKDRELGKHFQKLFIESDMINRFRNGSYTAKDLKEIGKLTGQDRALLIQETLHNNGIVEGTPVANYLQAIMTTSARHYNRLSGAQLANAKWADKWLRNEVTMEMNVYREMVLKEKKKGALDGNRHEIEKQIKQIKEDNKQLEIENELLTKDFNKDFKKLFDYQMAKDAVSVRKVGGDLKVSGRSEFVKLLKEKGIEVTGNEIGYIHGKKIYINRDAALATHQMGVGIHEIVHKLLINSLKHAGRLHKGKVWTEKALDRLKKNNPTKYREIMKLEKKNYISPEGKKIIDQFLEKIGKENKAILDAHIENKLLEIKYDSKGKERHFGEYYEEYLAYFGQFVKQKQIKSDYNIGRKAANALGLWNILKRKGWMENLYKFNPLKTNSKEAVRDFYDMIMELQSEGITPEIKEWFESTKKAGEGLVKEGVEFSKIEVREVQEKIDMHLNPRTNKSGREYRTKEDWQSSKDFVEVYNKIANSKLLDNMIMFNAPEGIPRPVKGQPMHEATKKYIQEVKDRLATDSKALMAFDPAKNNSVSGWLVNIMEFIKLDVAKAYVKAGAGRKTSLDKMVGDGIALGELIKAPKDVTYENIENAIQTFGAENTQMYSKLRRDLNIDSKMMDVVKQAVIKTFGTRLPDVNSKKFKSELEKAFRTELKKEIQDMIGSRENYNKFLLEHFEGVFNSLPVETLVQMERSVKPENRIFTTSERITKPTEVDRLISEGRLPKDVSRTSGPQLHTKNSYPGTERVMAFFRGVDMAKQLGYEVGGSTLGTRKDKLAMEIGVELAFDATMEVMQMPEVIKKREGILELDGKQRLNNELAIIAKQINRSPDVKFAKAENKGNVKHIEKLLNDIFKNGYENAISQHPTGKYYLTKDYPGMKISQASIDKVAVIWEMAKISEGASEGFKKLIEKDPRQWAEDVKQIILAEGNFDKYNPKLIEQIQKDLEVVLSVEGIKGIKEIMDMPGFWDNWGYHVRIMPASATKNYPGWKNLSKKQQAELIESGMADPKGKWMDGKNNYISDPHYKHKQKLLKGLSKHKDNAKIRELVKNSEGMNKKFALFKEIEKITFEKELAKKKEKLAKLEDRINKAGEANIAINKHIMMEMMELVKNKKIDQSTFIHVMQAQTNLVAGFRALTRLDLIYLTEGSQAVYQYINKKGELKYTNDATRTETINGKKVKIDNDVNLKNPDLKAAREFYKNEILEKEKKKKKNFKSKDVIEIESLNKALEQLTTKGEHLMPNANTMVEMVRIMSDYSNGIIKSKDALSIELDAALHGHSQLFTSKYIADVIDKGGRNNTSSFHRIKLLDKFGYKGNNYVNSITSAGGKSYYEVLAGKELSKLQSETRDRAIERKRRLDQARSAIKFAKAEKRGMSAFDFDDTLARTKGGVRVTMPNLDGMPKPGRKVVFLAGGAGSGKSNVVKKLELENQGFKIVNQDISLEWLKKNHGLPENMRELTKEQRSTLGKLGHQARQIAKRKMMKFQGKGDGVVIDGTGASLKNMEKLVNEFKDKGYDVSMLYVETSLKTALARNAARKERSLLDIIVRKNHESVQANKLPFKEMFKERFMEVKTDKLTMDSPMPKELISKMRDFVSGYEKKRIDAEQFALEGEKILRSGGKFDFIEFNKVVEGTEGPYLKNALEKAKKYGTKDMFVLTARPAAAAKPIHEFLKSMGLNIPIENITGLGNSTGAAKAEWMLEKFKEGYNDMFFVDDAMPNVKAVKELLEQLDTKSKVVQAKVKFSKALGANMGKMLERKSKGKILETEEISPHEAKYLGRGKGRFDFFVPASAEDFRGLMYGLIGKGKQGNADVSFLKKALFDPFAKSSREMNIIQQKMAEEYKTLKKEFKDVKKQLNKNVPGTQFTVDHALRVYLWEKHGMEIPGISEGLKRTLLDHVAKDPKLIAFAETLGAISRVKEGYLKPGDYWMVENISTDLNSITKDVLRKEIFAEWIENKNIIFSEANMNKIEAIKGKSYREALENILIRMEKGTNRLQGIKDGPTKMWMDWINGAVGATMFVNVRSAMLQTISTVNFTNWQENNVFAQARAFANQKQFWKDFAFIMNSPMLKQRRGGLQIDVSASELTNAFERGGRNPKALLQWLLQKGFTPTRIADSFAIAFGGSGYYRNRLNMYKKQGLSEAKAQEKAWLDFQEIAERTQQSSRPDLISQQQAGPLGRIILAWQNTPMQMTRLMKKALSDVVNRRISDHSLGKTQMQSDINNISRIFYYGAMQNLWFYTLQSGLGWLMFGSDQEEMIEKKEMQVLNGSLDTLLRGTGVYGAALSTIKNTILKYNAEKEKPAWSKDMGNVIVEMVNLSPTIGSKVRKVYQALKSWEWNQGVAQELDENVLFGIRGARIENPNLHAIGNIVEAATNFPLARILNKANNMEEAITGNHEWYQRLAMITGWNRWNVGAKDEELEKAKDKAEQTQKEKNKQDKIQDKKDQGLKQVRCSATKSNGQRCGITTWTKEKNWKCQHHAAFRDGMDRDGDGIKEYQCTAYTKSKRRCKNKTENKNKRCYAHQ